jgi:hypothetical protein
MGMGGCGHLFHPTVDAGAPRQDGFADMKLSSTSFLFRDDVFWIFVFNYLLL